MKLHPKYRNILITLIILIIVGLIGILGWYLFIRKNTAINTPPTSSYSRSGTDACVEKYYTENPESRPENHVKGKIYLAPPCPGIPQ